MMLLCDPVVVATTIFIATAAARRRIILVVSQYGLFLARREDVTVVFSQRLIPGYCRICELYFAK